MRLRRVPQVLHEVRQRAQRAPGAPPASGRRAVATGVVVDAAEEGAAYAARHEVVVALVLGVHQEMSRGRHAADGPRTGSSAVSASRHGSRRNPDSIPVRLSPESRWDRIRVCPSRERSGPRDTPAESRETSAPRSFRDQRCGSRSPGRRGGPAGEKGGGGWRQRRSARLAISCATGLAVRHSAATSKCRGCDPVAQSLV